MSKPKQAPGDTRRHMNKESPSLPLFMSASRSRWSETVVLSGTIFREMHRYLKWASALARVSKEEAQVMMLDRAIGDYLKRDEAWQAQKRGESEGGPGDADGRGGGDAQARPPVPPSATAASAARGVSAVEALARDGK